MKQRRYDINSPAELLATLVVMFPAFASEFEDEDGEPATYHEVIRQLTPVITTYLRDTPTQVEAFCNLVNALVCAGGDKENAISTCLLEHASQVKVRNTIRPYLSCAAKQELR